MLVHFLYSLFPNGLTFLLKCQSIWPLEICGTMAIICYGLEILFGQFAFLGQESLGRRNTNFEKF